MSITTSIQIDTWE